MASRMKGTLIELRVRESIDSTAQTAVQSALPCINLEVPVTLAVHPLMIVGCVDMPLMHYHLGTVRRRRVLYLDPRMASI